jgi:hypothetical protein
VKAVRKALLGILLTLVILGVAFPTYAYLNSYSGHPWTKEGTRGLQGFGRNMLRVEVSEEFKQKVIDIASLDPNVQDLLNNDYSVASVRPIIKVVVQGNGDITMKSTGATVILTKEKVGLAFVEVDLEAGKVTRINIISETAIHS